MRGVEPTGTYKKEADAPASGYDSGYVDQIPVVSDKIAVTEDKIAVATGRHGSNVRGIETTATYKKEADATYPL